MTGRVTVVDRIRVAQSDDLAIADPSETDVIFHSVELNQDVITDPKIIL